MLLSDFWEISHHCVRHATLGQWWESNTFMLAARVRISLWLLIIIYSFRIQQLKFHFKVQDPRSQTWISLRIQNPEFLNPEFSSSIHPEKLRIRSGKNQSDGLRIQSERRRIQSKRLMIQSNGHGIQSEKRKIQSGRIRIHPGFRIQNSEFIRIKIQDWGFRTQDAGCEIHI